MGNCNAPDWTGAMPRPPSRTRQLVDAMAAFQMVHVMEGVIIRGTATVLRDLNRPLFGKTGTTNGPTNVWFVGGTPESSPESTSVTTSLKPMGGWAQGGRISAPVWKQWALTALKDQPKVPFVAPPGIRWVRIDRASGKPVFGVFPTTTKIPKASVIWEAFQPQTEAVHSTHSTFGDPYGPQYLQLWQQAGQQAAQQALAGQQPSPRAERPRPSAPAAAAPSRTDRLANPERALVALLPERFLKMRAEAQAHIDQINAATALLRRFLDWDRALKRLDELNAKVEDSNAVG